MRKALIAFLALVLVCGCGAALAAQAVSAPREEILFQEHIFSGDPAAADGLTVQLKTGMRYKLNWESTVQFSAQSYRAETSFRFLPAGQAEQQEIRYRGVEINFYRDAATSGDAGCLRLLNGVSVPAGHTFARRKRFHDDPVCRLLRRISV